MIALPERYAYLRGLGAPPRMLTEALALYGVKETPGPGDNSAILAWAAETGLAASYKHDETPWCGLFMAVVAHRAGKAIPAAPLWALNWQYFGRQVERGEAAIGDVLVWKRKVPTGWAGHVNEYVGEDETHFHGIGGNQGDAVSIIRKPKSEVVAVRRALFSVGQPAGVMPWRVAAIGTTGASEA